MTTTYDIDIDNYSDAELLKILKISIPINALSVSQLRTHLKTLIAPLLSTTATSSYSDIITFFKQAADRIEHKIKNMNKNSIVVDSTNDATYSPMSSYTSNSNINSNSIDSISHPINTKKIPSAINENITKYPQGIINPIEKKTITKIINIDSTFRPNYNSTTSTSFMWNLIQRETNVVSMRVSSVDIPILWYSITDKMKRNEFQITLYNINNLSHIIHTIAIPPGNYMSDSFTNMLNVIFKKQAGGLEYLTSDIDTITSKIIIRANHKDDVILDTTGLTTHAAFDPSNNYYAPNFYFSINFFPQIQDYNDGYESATQAMFREFQRTVGWYIGFRNYTYEIRQSDKVTHPLYDPYHNSLYYECAIESESSYSSGRDNYIFLNIDDFNRNSVCQPIVSSTNNGYIGDNILARITVDSIHNSVLFENGSDLIFKERIYMGPVTIEKMHISVLNRHGEIINLNSNDYSLTLELTKIY